MLKSLVRGVVNTGLEAGMVVVRGGVNAFYITGLCVL